MIDLSPIIETLAALHSRAAVYTPHGGEPVEVEMIPGRDDQRTRANRSVHVQTRSEDWLLPVSSYAPDPQPGDRFIVYYHDRETTWELRSAAPFPVWEWSDRDKRLRRLHCVEVASS